MHRPTASRSSRLLPAVLMLAAAVPWLAGCGSGDAKAARDAGQAVARVNAEEISIHQVNFVLQRTPGVTSENADAASRQILDRLVSQEIAVQQAREMKLDRNPAVLQAMEAARREVLANAYLDKLGEAVAKPTAADVSDFYAKRPALFRQRKLYTLQDVTVFGTDAEVAQVRERLGAARTPADFVTWLRGSGIRNQIGQGVVSAENIPLEMLDRVAALQDGQHLFQAQPGGARITIVVRTEAAPLDEATARPAIEQFILNDRRRQKVEADMKALRASAKVEYFGKFAQAATTPAAAPAATAAPAAGALGTDAVKKGLGLK